VIISSNNIIEDITRKKIKWRNKNGNGKWRKGYGTP
jgi:hypothetical protein